MRGIDPKGLGPVEASATNDARQPQAAIESRCPAEFRNTRDLKMDDDGASPILSLL